jgi:hypothetical protein
MLRLRHRGWRGVVIGVGALHVDVAYFGCWGLQPRKEVRPVVDQLRWLRLMRQWWRGVAIDFGALHVDVA